MLLVYYCTFGKYWIHVIGYGSVSARNQRGCCITLASSTSSQSLHVLFSASCQLSHFSISPARRHLSYDLGGGGRGWLIAIGNNVGMNYILLIKLNFFFFFFWFLWKIMLSLIYKLVREEIKKWIGMKWKKKKKIVYFFIFLVYEF